MPARQDGRRGANDGIGGSLETIPHGFVPAGIVSFSSIAKIPFSSHDVARA
jgi:hypothetical protein